MTVPYYIGPDKIKEIEEIGDMVKVIFETKEMPVFLKRRMYDKSISIQPITVTELRERRLAPLMQEIMKVFLDWDIKICEIEPLFLRLSNFINDKISYASAKLWMPTIKNKPDPKKWHHNDIEFERTIGDINQVFEDEPKK